MINGYQDKYFKKQKLSESSNDEESYPQIKLSKSIEKYKFKNIKNQSEKLTPIKKREFGRISFPATEARN